MEKKSKVTAALAAGALAILVASGAARCTLAAGAGDEPPLPGKAAEALAGEALPAEGETPASPAPSPQPDPAPEPPEKPATGLASLANTEWESGDGAFSLSLMDGAMVERSDSSARVLYFTVQEEAEDSGGTSATILVSDTMTGVERGSVVRVESAPGGQTLSCDELSAVYLRKAPSAQGIELRGATEELCEQLGASEEEIEAVLSRAAGERSPHATAAVWDGQLWIDRNAGTVVAGFSLDDAASTTVTLTSVGGGKPVAS